MDNMLTTKELTIIQDLLLYEENACKKTEIYSKTLTNQKLAELMTELNRCHQANFERLLEII